MRNGIDIATTQHDCNRRRVVRALLAGIALPLVAPRALWAALPTVEVWTSPSCGCCHDWIAHLRTHGFDVVSHEGGNAAARVRLGMPARFGSCHTASIDGYAIEGHVPAGEIVRLLDERPDAIGLAVPAMPRGSPGMDGPQYGGVEDPYDVLLIGRDGSPRVFESYR